MSPIRYLAAVAFAASGALVAAQGQCRGTTTISTAPQATEVGGCPSFDGDIIIDDMTVDNLAIGPTLTEITGDLVADTAVNMTGLSADSLQTIGGSLELISLTALTELRFPVLTDVGTLTLQSLPPSIFQLDLTLERVGTLSIQDTQLQNFDGINLKRADNIDIANNRYVRNIELDITEIGTLMMTANGDFSGGIELSFPDLESAKEITIANATSLDIGSLTKVSQLLTLQFNTFDSVAAPKLEECGGLTISGNNQLTSMNFDNLETVDGALLFGDCLSYTGTVSFPAVTRINAALDMQGAFNGLDFPELQQVTGRTTILSTSRGLTSGECSSFTSNNQLLGQPIRCEGGQDESQIGSVTGSGSGPAATSTGAAVPNADAFTPGVYGVSAFIAAIVGMFL